MLSNAMCDSEYFRPQWGWMKCDIRMLISRSASIPIRSACQGLWSDLVERVMGIEPTLLAWEAKVLPLNYTRSRPTLSVVAGAGASESRPVPVILRRSG
jgi:hypothetical protein